MLSLLSGSTGAITAGMACTLATGVTTLAMKWNSHAYEWGAYEITGCTGINPKLSLAAGTTYTFDQSDASNWYHPVGFSYIAGGAHTSCLNSAGVAGECPELGGETGASTLQYFVNGVAVTSDASGFGLDAYEPLFFNSQGWWGEQTAFKVTLTIPADASYTRIYYFCHIHAGMSAEIEVTGSSAATKTVIAAAHLGGMTQTTAQAIYTGIVTAEQKAVNAYDQQCGTHKTFASSTHSVCTNSHFLCGAGSHGEFEKCLKAIDCQMHHDMAVNVPTGSSKFATFARQMIPHHQNAVAMAKTLAKHHGVSDYPAPIVEDQDMAWANTLIRNIINAQNFQIQGMLGWLEANPALAGATTHCYNAPPPPPPPNSPSLPPSTAMAVASPPNAPPPAAYTVKMAVTIAGAVSDFTPAVLTPIRQKVADEAAVPLDAVEATATAGSVKIDFTVSMQSEAAANTALTAITAKLADKTVASTFLSTTANPVTVEEIVAPTKLVLVSPSPPTSPAAITTDDGSDGLGAGAAVGIAVGCAVAGLLVGVGITMILKGKQARP